MGGIYVVVSTIVDIFRCYHLKEPIPIGRNIIMNTASVGVQAYFTFLVGASVATTWAGIGVIIGANFLIAYGVSELIKFIFDIFDKNNRTKLMSENAKSILGFSKDENAISPEEINKRYKLVSKLVHPDKNIEKNSTELTEFFSLLHNAKEFLLSKQKNTRNNILHITYNK
jgi:hypothetical protein